MVPDRRADAATVCVVQPVANRLIVTTGFFFSGGDGRPGPSHSLCQVAVRRARSSRRNSAAISASVARFSRRRSSARCSSTAPSSPTRLANDRPWLCRALDRRVVRQHVGAPQLLVGRGRRRSSHAAVRQPDHAAARVLAVRMLGERHAPPLLLALRGLLGRGSSACRCTRSRTPYSGPRLPLDVMGPEVAAPVTRRRVRTNSAGARDCDHVGCPVRSGAAPLLSPSAAPVATTR